MRLTGQQPEGARRRLDLDLNPLGALRHVEVVRGRAGYGFTVSAQAPCLLSGILEGSLADRAGLRRGDRVMEVNGVDVSRAPHHTVVQLIGTCAGTLRLAVLGDGDGDHLAGDDGRGLSQKVGVFRTVSGDPDHPSVWSPDPAADTRTRPVSEPDMSHWSQHLDFLATGPPREERDEEEEDDDTDSVFTEPEEATADWSILNMTMAVGYLGSTELSLNTAQSEESCLEAVRRCIRQLGTEQDTHTLVLMKVMFDRVRLCDDAGASLAAFPAENLLLGAVCAEDGRFFCLVTTAHVSDGGGGPIEASCHVFFVDPELVRHRDHLDIARRFGFDCTADPDAAGCLEFPHTPQDVLHFVSVLYGDMGEAVERLRVRLEAEAQLQDEEGGKQGSASSNGDSGIGNASPPEERTDRDFPPAEVAMAVTSGSHTALHLPSCPWDYPVDEELTPHVTRAQTLPSLRRDLDQAYPPLESLSGPGALTGLYGGPPPGPEFHFKPPPPPLPPGKKQKFLAGPLRSSQKWFSKQKLPKVRDGPPEYRVDNVWPSSVSLGGAHPSFLPPPMSQIPADRYDVADPGAMLPPKDDWTRRFLEQNARHQKEGAGKLQGCCSQSSLNSNGSLTGGAAGVPRRLSDQRVASWAACFERLLQDPIGVRYFSEFLKKEFSEENILFWQACEYFSHVPAADKKQLSQRAGEIYDSFLSSKATTPVNIDSQAQLADDIFNLMKFDSYSRFLKSSLYQECVLAELEGRSLPDPYQIPCSPAPSKHSASSDRSALSTPRKEASRKQRSGRSPADDARDDTADKKRGMFFSWSRNRSFGKGPKKKDVGDVNFDNWGSNGRRESQGSLSSGTSMEMTTSCSAGRLESVAGWERARDGVQKQCTVTLPDGSCSTVVLRGGATIREVLRDLCLNMAVNMAAVDLFLVGGEKPLVLDQDCMTLSSRDLRMEKRTLFRLDLVPINRSVGLKAKPTKPVSEVLRPVVAKYGLHLSDLVAKISGETQPLDLGAPISSLDGLRVGYPPTRSLSATGDERSSGKDFSLRASGSDAVLPGEKTKHKKINIDEAEEFFELLSRAQSSRANDQRGLLSKEDLACSTPDGHKRGRENGPRGPFGSSLRSESLDSPLGPCCGGGPGPNGHAGPPLPPARRALLLPLPRHPPFGTHLSPIARPPEPPPRGLRTVDEDLTLVGEGEISSPNSTLLPPSPCPLLSFDRSLPEANFTPPPPPCSRLPPEATPEDTPDPCTPATAPPPGAPEGQAAAGVVVVVAAATPPDPDPEGMDVEGVRLEEGGEGARRRPPGDEACPELSLSFQGYVAELRQCQSKMRHAQGPQSGAPPTPEEEEEEEEEGPQGDVYKATIV
ncbi:hypothetical protein NHX12_013836 [Muraenolepis orangiensis]|uniref:Regulator of G-protein signaling 12 n=1 Tax=Muraenolepis orangiensis TaxID=630683 RepID=A0A9Q0I413_9TELE|nr:hypothetical protein NHX12_013836 [Muraenolepis orangiensis]